MDRLIPLINKLQDVFHTVGAEALQLPQIVVVGSQSSGKSSVLESLVGRDFLPRGTGIVTRRPLILQLLHTPSTSHDHDFSEWGQFLHDPDKLYVKFEEIRDEIERETDRTSSEKAISPMAINLKIFSPHVLNLTLVDLPGVTKVPVGNQPDDIEQIVLDLIMKYISNPHSIILAVTPANTDVSTSDALQIARRVDPHGNRTIGVCTKLDLMDAGTDASDVLSGRVVPVKLGFIGVVNRSQADIQQCRPIAEALQAEQDFFARHPMYASIADHCGTPYLARTLNKVLLRHIRESLPDLRIRLSHAVSQAQAQFAQYGDPVLERLDKGALLLSIITRFSTSYCNAIEGTTREIQTQQLSGGARMCFIFHETFGRTLQNMDPLDGLTVNDIRTAIRNATGTRLSLFVPEVAFELLVKRQIRRLLEPSLRCVELVFDELLRIIAQSETQEVTRFETLRETINETVTNMLRARLPYTNSMIENLIEIELAYINTNHPDFTGGSRIGARMAERAMEYDRRETEGESSFSVTTTPHVSAAAAASAVNSTNGASAGAPGPSVTTATMSSQSLYTSTAASSSLSDTAQQQLHNGAWGLSNLFFGRNKQRVQPATNVSSTSNANPSSNFTSASPSDDKNDDDVSVSSDVTYMIQAASKQMNPREYMETELIKQLIVSYFKIVRKNIQDAVPKAIMHFLVNWIRENVQQRLVVELYSEKRFNALLEESPVVAARRTATSRLLEALQRAQAVLGEVKGEMHAERL